MRQAREVLDSLKEDPLAERCLRIVDLLAPQQQSYMATSGFTDASTMLYELLQSTPTWNIIGHSPNSDLAPDL